MPLVSAGHNHQTFDRSGHRDIEETSLFLDVVRGTFCTALPAAIKDQYMAILFPFNAMYRAEKYALAKADLPTLFAQVLGKERTSP